MVIGISRVNSLSRYRESSHLDNSEMNSVTVALPETINFSDYGLNPPSASSRHRGWNDLLVERFHQPPGQIKLCYRSEHTICLSLAPRPIKSVQVKGGRVRRGLLVKGDISITPARLVTSTRWEAEEDYLQIRLDSRFLEKVATEALGIDSNRIEVLPEFHTRDMHIEQIGMMLLSELRNEGLGGRLYVESLANMLAVHLLRNYSTASPRVSIYSGGLPEHQLLQVTDYINEHLTQEIKLSDMAETLDMSSFYFARLFKQSMRVSPYQYVILQRVMRAKQLLKCQELSITEVALQCGFNSQSHLGKWFRQLTGTTPKAYQKK